MKVKIQIIVAIFASLLWVGAASAQATSPPKKYSLSVSRHIAVPELSGADVKRILADASKMLQTNRGHACNVKFTLRGSIGTFGSPNTPTANIPSKVDADHIEAVHSVDSGVDSDVHIKVVEEIKPRCFGPPHAFQGCSFPHRFRSIIVVHPDKHTVNVEGIDKLVTRVFPHTKFPDHLLWAHEFGHLTGLNHRTTVPPMDDMRDRCEHATDRDRCALMRDRDVIHFALEAALDRVQVDERECNCFLGGPKSSETCP